MPLLLALLSLLGPHATDAALHAGDPEAPWVRAAPVLLPERSAAIVAPVVKRRVYGYLPYWESSIDLGALRWDLLTDVIAFSAEIGADGTVTNAHGLPGAALLSAAHQHGVRVHLCATLFNTSTGSEIATFLGSAAAQGRAVQALVSLASGLDGLNLDFEYVPSASRDAFTAFVQTLHGALRAASPGAELTLAMPATTSYSGYDVKALAAASERLLLMEYDWHWRTAPTSGANAPLPSVTAAVDGFLALAPAASMAMGVPYYGWDWPTAAASPGASTTAGGASVLFGSVFANFASYGRLWDAGSQTPWYTYLASGQQHQAWVEDGESLALKYQAVNARGLAGVMIWALGYDAGRSEAWTALEAAFRDPQAPPAPPPASGCTHADQGPLLALAAVLALGAARRRLRRVREDG